MDLVNVNVLILVRVDLLLSIARSERGMCDNSKVPKVRAINLNFNFYFNMNLDIDN